MTEEIKIHDCKEILTRHLNYNPTVTIVASCHAGGKVSFDFPSNGNIPDLVFMHKLLGMKIDGLLAMDMNNKSGSE